MNYFRIYHDIIMNARQRGTPDGYYERHHILPRSLGGTDHADNIAPLSPREHFICHYLLTKMYSEGLAHSKMCYAFMLMKGQNPYQHRYFNSRLYSAVRSLVAEQQSDRRAGVELSGEHKVRISESLKQHHAAKGVSASTRMKISQALAGKKRKPFTEERRKILSEAMKRSRQLKARA